MDLFRRAVGATPRGGAPPLARSRSTTKWNCSNCTLENDAMASVCVLCGATPPVADADKRPLAGAGAGAGSGSSGKEEEYLKESLADFEALDKLAKGDVSPLDLMMAPDTFRQLQNHAVAMKNLADEKDREIVLLREALQAQAKRSTEFADETWDTIGGLVGKIDVLEGRYSVAQATELAEARRAEAMHPVRYTTTIGLPVIEDKAIAALRPKIAAHHVTRRWRQVALNLSQRRLTWIQTHSFAWIETAKAKVAKVVAKRQMIQLLKDQKAGGVKLSIMEENAIRDPDVLTDPSKEYECPLCWDDVTAENLLVLACKEHRVCLTCMGAYAKAQLDEGHSDKIMCPVEGCRCALTFDDIRISLLRNPHEFARYQRFLLESCLEADPLMTRCPKPKCQTAMIRNSRAATMCICPNPSCKYSFCADCKVEWHSDATCKQYQDWKKENAAADDLFDKWRAKHTKPCPKASGGCDRPIQKNGGCNHMTCTKCSHQFCWLCMKKYKSGHYNESGPCKGKQFT